MGQITHALDLTPANWAVCDDLYVLASAYGFSKSIGAASAAVQSGRRCRLLGVACLRVAWRMLTDERLRWAVEAAENYSDNPDPAILAAGTAAYLDAAQDAEPGESPQGALRLAIWQLLAGDDHFPGHPLNPHWPDVVDFCEMAYDQTHGQEVARANHLRLFHDLFPNPFRPVRFAPEWRTDVAVRVAGGMYQSHDFTAMPILADALQGAGCDSTDILNHCHGSGPHVRGCWAVDLVLGKE